MLYIISLSNMLYIIPWLNHYMKMSDSFQLGWGDVAHFLILGIPLFNPEGVFASILVCIDSVICLVA